MHFAASDKAEAVLEKLWEAAECAGINADSGVFRRTTDWLRRQIAAGGEFTFESPASQGFTETVVRPELLQPNVCWLPQRFVWWPNGIPARPWISIVSSRIGTHPERRPEWLAALRAACDSILAANGMLAVGVKTTAADLLLRAAERWALPVLQIRAPHPRDTLGRWFEKLPRIAVHDCRSGPYRAFVSPKCTGELGGDQHSVERFPVEDRATIGWSDDLYVLHLKPQGNIEQLVRRRLHCRMESGNVWLATGESLVAIDQCAELFGIGAKSWHRATAHDSRPGSEAGTSNKLAHSRPRRPRKSHVQFPSDVLPAWSYLVHCTHAPRGPWPGQSEADYWDELIDLKEQADRGPFGAIARILTHRRIWSSGCALRGNVAAVCFSERRLDELHLLRAFQPQRGCWRFEPYGIAVRREWLAARGCRPVIYGDDDTWRSLAEEDKPFFQRRLTQRGEDWSAEREWRHLGDVDLTSLNREDALVFVPTAEEAERLAGLSPWPVISASASVHH